MATLQSLAILLSMREISHTLSSYPACAHPHLAIARLGRLEDALLDESLLAECFRAEVLPLVLLLLPSRLHLLHLLQFLFLLLLEVFLLFYFHFSLAFALSVHSCLATGGQF